MPMFNRSTVYEVPMTDAYDRINQALDLAAAGAIDDACERLWPLMREPEGREEALFTMACCFERAHQLPPAAYLFGWVAERYPDFVPAREHRDRCVRLMAERGLHEDFNDSGHVACRACTLHYRAELPLCPYCGGTVAGPDVNMALVPVPAPEPKSRDVLDEIGRGLDRAWKNAQERFDAFTKREDLSGPALRVQEFAREAKTRAQSFAESDRGKQLKQTVSEFGDEAAKRLRSIAENEKVKSAARQTRDLGEEALNKVKTVASREEVKDAQGRVVDLGRGTAQRVREWTEDDQNKSAAKRVYDSVDRFIGGIQAWLDQITGRKESAPPQEPKDGAPPSA